MLWPILQFERKQVSERVSANFQARAARGLYNGGVLPLGYKLNPKKPGYLAIEEEQAEVVRKAFAVFLVEGSLAKTARWLNENGIRAKRKTDGGGLRPRLGHFTCQNLRVTLNNKAYAGIRRFKVFNKIQEVEACWEPIIDLDTFQQAQGLLAKSKIRKPESKARYPYLLSGLTFCARCKYHLHGKSATGNSGKVPYYEHGWATKAQGCLPKKPFNCQPHRISGKKLEQGVWEQVEKLLTEPQTAEDLIAEAKRIHSEQEQTSEVERHRTKINAVESQLEALVERLSELPKTVSAAPIYQQMEKLEAQKRAEAERIQAIKESRTVSDIPARLTTYRGLLQALNQMNQSPNAKTRIIEALIHRIEISPEGYRLHYYAGENQIEKELTRRTGLCAASGSTRLTNGGR